MPQGHGEVGRRDVCFYNPPPTCTARPRPRVRLVGRPLQRATRPRISSSVRLENTAYCDGGALFLASIIIY